MPQDGLEEEFFGPLDSKAAQALRQMRDKDCAPLGSKSKEAFAYFLNSLIEREPEILQRHESLAQEVGQRLVEEVKQKPDPHGKWARVLELIEPNGMAANLARREMVARIDDAPFLQSLCSQRWRIVDVPKSSLVTSDRPLLVNLDGQANPVHFLRIALSPSRLLLTHPPAWEIDDDLMKMLVLSYNLQVVQNAWSFVISDHELCGIEQIVNYPLLLEKMLKHRSYRQINSIKSK